MIEDTFVRCLAHEFPFELNAMQSEAAKGLAAFALSTEERRVHLLKGYAGTGKTSLVAAMVRTLVKLRRPVMLMAPTGRAAKVFSHHAGHPALTIHKVIYCRKKKNDREAGFTLNYNKFRHTLFIVDEASMVANDNNGPSLFGSGQLLQDLVQFVYSGAGCKMILVGDTAQLPPVGEELSPALSPAALEELNLSVTHFELTEVMRQSEQSGILYNATRLRLNIGTDATQKAPIMKLQPFQDIKHVPGAELIDALERSYDQCGTEGTIVITRSNKRANAYNNGIRATIFGREEGITAGDIVMIARNNYYWTEQVAASLPKEESMPIDFIANGDIAIVRRIRQFHEFYGLHFADVTLAFPDYDDFEMDVRVILDALTSETPALSADDSDKLYHGVLEDYAEFPQRRKRMEKLRQDPNYNAIQIKYAYAVTCHKAQGGQWEHVYVDQGWLPDDGIDASYYRWLYTALTRATRQLFLVNWPSKQTEQ